MEIYGNLVNSFRFSDNGVDLTELTAIPKSCQRPERNSSAQHLHVSPMTVRFESLLPNWWSCCRHKSHLRCGDRTWFPDFNWNCPGHTWRIKLHNGPHYIPKVLRLLPRRAIPVQSCSSFDWVGGHRPNVVKVRKTILHRWKHMSWTIKQEDCLLSWVKSNSYSEIEIISNSHPVPYSCKRQEQLQNIKTWTNWQSSFVSNIDGRLWKSMEISSILFRISDN